MTIDHRELLDQLYDGVYFVDKDRVIQYWNKSAEKITGYASAEVTGKSCRDNVLNHIDSQGNCLCEGPCPLSLTMEDGLPREAHVYLHHKNGFRLGVSVRTTCVRDSRGDIIGGVEIFNDNSDRVRLLREVEQLELEAYRDSLTGLVNRRYIESVIESKLVESSKTGVPFGLLFADVDNFKAVNDTYGHGLGDIVLKLVGDNLRFNCRSNDIPARWGGEEFVIVAFDTGRESLFNFAERLRIMVMNSTIALGQTSFGVTVSVGATLSRDGDDLESLLKRGDCSMYESKIAGKNRVTIQF